MTKGLGVAFAILMPIAIAAISVPFIAGERYWEVATVMSFILGALWAILFLVALFRFKWQGLWLLVGAPLALYFPLLGAFFEACQRSHSCP
jgi:hypothetical protein